MNKSHVPRELSQLGQRTGTAANWRRREMQAIVVAAVFIAAVGQMAMADVILSGGGLTLLEEGGSFADSNLARMASAVPMAIDEWQADNAEYHRIEHLNDGLYGNAHSWIGWAGTNVHGVAFAGISLGAYAIPGINKIAFGRDNIWPYGYTDRTLGNLFTLQYTQVPEPHTNVDLPDDTSVAGTTATTGWETIGTLDYQSAGGTNFTYPRLRHLYGFDPVDATGVRLVVPIGNGATRPCIDEIELYGPQFGNLDFEDAVITVEPPPDIYSFVTVPASEALPQWSTNGALGTENPTVGYDSICLGAGCTSIHDEYSLFVGEPLQGHYSVLLQGPVYGAPTVPLYISQVGMVPHNATKLAMLVNCQEFDVFDVSFDDGSGSTSLPLLTPFPRNETVRLVYDISEFSGVFGELKISSSEDFESHDLVDAIQFIPEPSALLLAAMAGVGLLLRGRRRVI